MERSPPRWENEEHGNNSVEEMREEFRRRLYGTDSTALSISDTYTIPGVQIGTPITAGKVDYSIFRPQLTYSGIITTISGIDSISGWFYPTNIQSFAQINMIQDGTLLLKEPEPTSLDRIVFRVIKDLE